MDFNRKAIAIQVEGIPDPSGFYDGGALFYYGHDPSSIDDVGIDYGTEEVLTEMPGSLDASVDIKQGTLELSAMTFSLAATDSVCKRFLSNDGSAGDAGSKLLQNIDDEIQDSIDLESTEPIEVGQYLYIGNETVYVDAVSQSGTTYTLDITRGVAGSTAEPHNAESPVYLRPPYLKFRQVEFRVYDLDEPLPILRWYGVIDDVSTDDQQTEVVLSASDTMSVLWGTRGGERVTFSGEGLSWDSNDRLDGHISNAAGADWVNPNQNYHNVRVGDVAYRMRLDADAGHLIANSQLPSFDTAPDVDPADDNGVKSEPLEDEEVSLFLAWSHTDTDGQVANDFEGCHGVDGQNAHPAAIALALLMSTGTGENNLTDPNSFAERTFDVLGEAWGMGVPAKLIDARSWLEVIDTVALSIDRMVLGWDGEFGFQETIIPRLLVNHDLFPYVTAEGKVGLRHFDTWVIDDATKLSESKAFVTLNPTKIKLDRQLRDFGTVIKANIGGTPMGEEPDQVKVRTTQGFRRDATLGQSAHEVDFSFYSKDAYRAESGQANLATKLEDMREKRLDNPPLLTCELPYRSDGGQAQLPPLGGWVALRGGPQGGLIGPEGTRVLPDDTETLFIGILVGHTIDMSSLDVECRVLLVNWWLKDRVPRLIAPASQISSYDAETGELELINYWPAADGTSGFLAGDQIQIRHPDGRRWHGDDGGHIVDDAWEDNGDHFVRIYRRFITPPESGLIIELAEFDEYDNPWWPGADIYQNYDVVSRRYAYLADSLGRLGAADREADIYC